MANSSTTTLVDWETLRKEGLEHLQAMSGDLWTDYNIHDPGVTLLELLCYAITDLDSRLSQDIAAIVTENTADTTIEHYFSPKDVLTINPVTINDYRKLLIDLPGVKNAWLTVVKEIEPALYYDKDNNAVLYDYASGSERIIVNGLYRVYIEKDEDVKDDKALKVAVLEQLHNHRNLGEDFVEVNIMEEETISVFSDIQIDENADAEEVMAQIYYDLEELISPGVKQYSLKRMLKKGKTIEEIFTGPQLMNGFIDDDDLGSGTKRQELHTSDLIRIIMARPEVKDVRNLYISDQLNPDIRAKQEWALVVDSTKALVLEPFNASKLCMFKNDTLCPVNSTTVKTKVASLKKEAGREMFDDPAMDLSETLGKIPDNLTDYSSIAYELPAAYGVSKTGLSSTASAGRQAQAKQLRAYLLFFEQILVNYLKQLDSFKRLFAFRQDQTKLLKSYFSRLLPEEIWAKDFKKIAEIIADDPTESLAFSEPTFKRKNRILDHLLAQFNEKFSDYALFSYQMNLQTSLGEEDRERNYLQAKAGFLENYPELSRNRNKAYNYTISNTGINQSDGLKNLIASKLGINIGEDVNGNDSEEFFIVEHILFRPDQSSVLDFICSERIAEDYQPDPYSYQLTFVIPKQAGRFSNSKFKELAYNTISNETPAHINYTVLEFTMEQMSEFTDVYDQFLNEFIKHKQGNSTRYNFYRSQLMNLLGIGRPRLPALHLDAQDVSGSGVTTEDETTVVQWTDLSGNSHDAFAASNTTAPFYRITGLSTKPSIHFEKDSSLEIEDGLITDDFSVAVVFETAFQSGMEGNYFPLVGGGEVDGSGFTLGFKGNGDVAAGIGPESINLESEADSPHLAVFVRDKTAGEIRLFVDGVLQAAKTLTKNQSLTNPTVVIKPGIPCDVGEVIILDSVLTGSRKEKLEDYISSKWGIPLSAVSSIAKPVFHLDANVSSGFTKDEASGKISAWKDLSQRSMKVVQTAPSSMPVYNLTGIGGLPAVHFDDTALLIPNTDHTFFAEDFTLGIVYQADAGEGRLLDGTATKEDENSFAITLGAKGEVEVVAGDETLQLSATLGNAHMVMMIGHVVADKLNVTLWLDGDYYNNAEFTDIQAFKNCPTELMLGRSRTGEYGFTGSIGEVVLFDQALTAWDRQRLEKFLSDKWQIDISGVESVATPILHLDAARLASVLDENGAVLDRGSKVYEWVDLTSSNHNATQDNTLRRPEYVTTGINSLGSIQFTQEQVDKNDYYDDSLDIDRIIQNDFTIMAVFQPDASYYKGKNFPETIQSDTDWTEGTAVIDADCSGRYNDFGLSFGKIGEKMIVMGGIGDRLTSDHTVQSGEIDFDSAHFITFTREKVNGDVKLYADGLLHAQADLRDNVQLNDSRSIKIGAFNSEGLPFHGLIGEIIVFDQVLSDSKRQKIEGYLSAKWQIPIVTLPIDTTGLIFHLDAATAGNITRDEANKVTQWMDKNEMSDIAATQGAAKYQPVYVAENSYGMPALRFNDSFMELALKDTVLDDITLAIVFNAQSTGDFYPGLDWAGLIDHYDPNGSNDFGLAITRDSELRVSINAQKTKTAVSLNTPHIGIISRNLAGGEFKIYLDGLLAATGEDASRLSFSELSQLTIGAIRILPGAQSSQGYYVGDISEMVLLNHVLSMSDRQNLEAYFAQKWQIDISGINNIIKPVLHLDASLLSTVQTDNTGYVSQWHDSNGLNIFAAQNVSTKQPLYQGNVYNELGALSFDSTRKTCMTLKPVVKDDFSVIIVYKAEQENSKEYMPVEEDSFTVIAGVSEELSKQIRNEMKGHGYIDENGNVLSAFTPGTDDFSLSLADEVIGTVQNAFMQGINWVLASYSELRQVVPGDAFTSIGGINESLSQILWQQLNTKNYLNSDGKVLNAVYAPDTNEFIRSVVESAVIDVVLAENWVPGVGLFDGNCAGDRGQLNKRDFGLLVGKDGELMAGIGVPDEQDYQLTQTAPFGAWHIGILTRVKDTGVARLYVDGAVSVEKKVALNVSLKDSQQFTIGAENTGGNYLTGYIGEIIVLDEVPTDRELSTIQSYLAKKWGITL